VGNVRPNNEDQFLIADLNKSMIVHHSTLFVEAENRLFSGVEGQLLLVADGVGGHAAGERASELTARTISNHILQTMPWFFRLRHDQEDHLHEELLAAVMRCEQIVETEALANEDDRDMGTTLTMSYVIWPRMYVVHVGDSRCYLFRSGQLSQITHDHTLLKMYEQQGIQLDEAQRQQYGRVLINSIGRGVDRLVPEVYKVDLAEGDTVLLCSDGLTDMVSDNDIQTILQQSYGNEQETCAALITAAKAAGGRDNITVVVSRYSGGDTGDLSEKQGKMSDTAEIRTMK
jgi:PPM family protein phosphatase